MKGVLMMISLIVAFDQNQLIGSENRLPWHYKDDLKYFKEQTMGHDILMGRSTFESILSYRNQPLPGRHHFVLTKLKSYNFNEVTVISDLPTFLKDYSSEKELFVIGGTSVYKQTFPYAERLYITHIEREFSGDAYFPKVDWSEWLCLKENTVGELRFAVYERRNAN